MVVQRVPFLDAVTDCTGGNAKVQRKDYLRIGDLPVIDQGQDFIAGYTELNNKYSGTLPVVLFGDHTRIFKYIDFPFALGADGVKVLQPSDGFDPQYLFYYFRSIKLPNAGYSRHFKFLKEIDVPKPSLIEQRCIIDLLSRAEGILRLRQEAEQKAAELIPSLFLHMFGDPATNPKGWPVMTVDEVGEVKLGRQRAPKYQTGKFTRPYVRVANVFENLIDVSDLLSMDFDKQDFLTYRLKHGDILLNEGQSIELVGRPAMWRDEVSDCCFQNTLIRFRCSPALVVPEFALASFLWMYHAGQFSQIASKTSNVAHLGAGRFTKLPIILPPLPLQVAFAKQAQRIEAIARTLDTATAKAEATFQSLLALTFTGNLAKCKLRGLA